MADVLQMRARRAARRVASEDAAPDRNARLRWLAIGALSLVALFLCVGLTFGKRRRARPRRSRRRATPIARSPPIRWHA